MPVHSALPPSTAAIHAQPHAVGMRTRTILLVAYAVLTLPVLVMIAVSSGWMMLLAVDMAIRAVPLAIAVAVDQTFLDGGELNQNLIPLWILLTGFVLWPLLVVGLAPSIWSSRRCRKGILCYSAAITLATVAAACWVFTHSEYFF